MDVEFERIELQMFRLKGSLSDSESLEKVGKRLSTVFAGLAAVAVLLGPISHLVREGFETSRLFDELKYLTGLPECALRYELARYPFDISTFLEEVKCGSELFYHCQRLAAIFKDTPIELDEFSIIELVR